MRKGKLISFVLILLVVFACGDDATNADFAPNTAGTGTGGSLASFMVTGDNLLVVSGSKLRSFNLTDGDGIELRGTLDLGSTLETIHPYEANVLIGANDAVYFIDARDPDRPSLISTYRHFTSCDPVVARRGIAYSTLRTTGCRWAGEEVLDVIDFSNINSPVAIATYSVQEPYGLAVTADYLFVCESRGITVFDNSTPEQMTRVEHFKFESGAIPFDMIYVGDDRFIVTTDDGIYNVEYSLEGTISVLGEITGV